MGGKVMDPHQFNSRRTSGPKARPGWRQCRETYHWSKCEGSAGKHTTDPSVKVVQGNIPLIQVWRLCRETYHWSKC